MRGNDLRLEDLTTEERELGVRLAGLISSMGVGTLTLKLHDGAVTQLEAAERFDLAEQERSA